MYHMTPTSYPNLPNKRPASMMTFDIMDMAVECKQTAIPFGKTCLTT